GGNKAPTEQVGATESHFSGSRIDEELDILYSLTEIIEHGRSAIEQDPTILSQQDALGVAVEQSHANSPFQFRDRPRNGGLGCIEQHGGLAHVAGLHHGHQDMKIVQLHTESDAVTRLHFGTIAGWI